MKICSGFFSVGSGALCCGFVLMIGGGGSTANRAAADVIGITGLDGRAGAVSDVGLEDDGLDAASNRVVDLAPLDLSLFGKAHFYGAR